MARLWAGGRRRRDWESEPESHPQAAESDLTYLEKLQTNASTYASLDCIAERNQKRPLARSVLYPSPYAPAQMQLCTHSVSHKGILQMLEHVSANLPSAKSLGKRKQQENATSLSQEGPAGKRMKLENGAKQMALWKSAGKHALEVNFIGGSEIKGAVNFETRMMELLDNRPEIADEVFKLITIVEDSVLSLCFQSDESADKATELFACLDTWASFDVDELIHWMRPNRFGKSHAAMPEGCVRLDCTLQFGKGPSKNAHESQKPRFAHLIFHFELFYSNLLFELPTEPRHISAIINFMDRFDLLDRLSRRNESGDEHAMELDGEDADTSNLSSHWFYNALKQAPTPKLSQTLLPPGLRSTLMPFQSDSVCWLLEREEVEVVDALIDGHHTVGPLSPARLKKLQQNPLWNPIAFIGDCDHPHQNKTYWHSKILDRLSHDEPTLDVDCGLLLHEMGLGKTVQILSLVLMHPEPERSALPQYFCERQQVDIQPTNLTLILCPLSILAQWESEIQKHAPSLRCYVYNGVKSLKEDRVSAKSLDKRYDIVLCSFEILREEVLYARAPPERQLRGGGFRRHQTRRSLLIEIDFLRVYERVQGMDEVQMAHNTAGAIAETASYIRRKYAFAISGTPLRSDISDLRGLLFFLGFSDLSKPSIFRNLLEKPHVLRRLLNTLAIRTTKQAVDMQIDIPRQERYVVPLEFGPIEGVAYKNHYIDAITDLGLDQNGNALSYLWRPRTPDMMTWLTRLRHICCHSSVRALNVANTAVASTSKAASRMPKTLSEVLASMRVENAAALFTSLRAQYAAAIRRAHLISRDRENCEGLEEGAIMLGAAVTGIKETMALVQEEIDRFKTDSDEDSAQRKIGSGRLRDLATLMHSAVFFKGNIFATIGTRKSEEDAAYGQAEQLRRDILRNEENAANSAMSRMSNMLKVSDMKKDLLKIPSGTNTPGLRTMALFEQVDDATKQLNKMADLLWDWRQQLVDRLGSKLVTEVTDNSADDYENDAVRQEEIDVLHDAYEMLLADWKYGLTGERIDRGLDSGSAAVAAIRQRLLEDAMAGKYMSTSPRKVNYRKNKSNQRKALQEAADDTPGVKLYKKLVAARELVQKDDIVNLRSSLRELRDISTSMLRSEEVAIASEESLRLRAILSERDRTYDALHKELHDILTPAFNARGEYFVALQKLSDSVTDINISTTKTKNFTREIEAARGEEIRQMQAVAKVRAKRKYLDFLHQNMASLPEDQRICSICGDGFQTGVFTSCGHLYCSMCLSRWLHRSQTCPICKSPLRRSDLQQVTFDEKGRQEVTSIIAASVQAENLGDRVALSYLDQASLAKIQSLPDIGADLGVKIDTIIKHIRSLRRDDPAAKVVLFSAWQGALDVCALAFDAKGIKYARLDKGSSSTKASKKNKASAAISFAKDPEIAVFILHTQSQAAGLNLTAAQTVILVEPLLHPSIELQAVGRVHRIGQTSETKVFQYVIKSTVDERLAQLNARNGHPLFLAERPNIDYAAESSQAGGGGTGPDQPSASRVANMINNNKNAEEALLDEWADEDVARLIFEDQEYATLQDCLLKTAEARARGDVYARSSQDTSDSEEDVEMPQVMENGNL